MIRGIDTTAATDGREGAAILDRLCHDAAMSGAPVTPRFVSPGLSPLEHCIECDYARTGLSRDQPCPECGAAPPPPDAIVLVGSTAPGSPLTRAMLGGGTALMFFAFAVAALRVGGTWLVTGLLTFSAVGVAYLSGVAYRARQRGGDVRWVVTSDAVRIRSTLIGDSVIPLRSLARCKRSGTLTGRWQRLRIVPRLLTIEVTRDIWLRLSRPDARLLRDQIEQRIRLARARSNSERDTLPPTTPASPPTSVSRGDLS